jgi:hypothetical protein
MLWQISQSTLPFLLFQASAACLQFTDVRVLTESAGWLLLSSFALKSTEASRRISCFCVREAFFSRWSSSSFRSAWAFCSVSSLSILVFSSTCFYFAAWRRLPSCSCCIFRFFLEDFSLAAASDWYLFVLKASIAAFVCLSR